MFFLLLIVPFILFFINFRKYLSHCGIMSNRFAKHTAMYRKQSTKPEGETTIQRIKRLTGIDVSCCPYCKKGKMLTVEIIPRIRSPVKFFSPKEKNKTLWKTNTWISCKCKTGIVLPKSNEKSEKQHCPVGKYGWWEKMWWLSLIFARWIFTRLMQ